MISGARSSPASQREAASRADSWERAGGVRPRLALVRAHNEALFPDKAQEGAAAPLSAEEQEERMAALFLLLDVIEDAVLAIGLTPPSPRSQSTPPPRREEPAR